MNHASRSLIIGTYTKRPEPGDQRPEGILAASYDGAGLTGPRSLARLPDPSWLATTADGRHLYAVAETTEFAGLPGGGVAAYALGPAAGLTPLNAVSSGGAEPAHLALDPAERFVVAANYLSGSVSVFAREPDGSLGALTGHVQHHGSGPHPVRQTGPHPHQIGFDPVTGDLLVPDLGLDAVIRYRLGDDGNLTELPPRITVPPGAGPRHLAFHPGGQYLFVVNELASTLTAWHRAGLVAADTIATVPDGFTGENHPSGVRVSASGRSVLVANRGHDSVAVFAFDPASGKLAPALVAPCGGSGPRDLILAPDGGRLLVANTDSDTVTVLDFDEHRPSLLLVSVTAVPSPACLRLLPAAVPR